MWNQLPLSIRTAASMASFKSQLTEFYKTKLSDSFDPYNTCTWVSCCRCSNCRPTYNSVVFLSAFVFLFSFWVGGVVIGGGGRGVGDLSLFLILVGRS